MPGGSYEEIGLVVDVKKQEDLVRLLEYLSKIETKFKETNGKEIVAKVGIDASKAEVNIEKLRKLIDKAFKEIKEDLDLGSGKGIFSSKQINQELKSFNSLMENFIKGLQGNVKDLDSRLIEIYQKSESISKSQLKNLLEQTAQEDDAYKKKINNLDKIKVKEEEIRKIRSEYAITPLNVEEFSQSGKNVRKETDLQSNLSRLKTREEVILRPNIDKLKDNLLGLDANFNKIKNEIPGLITQQEVLNNLISEEGQSLLRVTNFREKQQASLDILLKKEQSGNELTKGENIAKTTLQNNLISNLEAQEKHIQNLKALKSELIILDEQVEQNSKFINSYEDQRSKIVEKVINAEDKLYNNLDKQVKITEKILKLRQEIEKTYNKDTVDYYEKKSRIGEPLNIKPSTDPGNIQKWTGSKFNIYGEGKTYKNISVANNIDFEESKNKRKSSSYVIDKDVESIKKIQEAKEKIVREENKRREEEEKKRNKEIEEIWADAEKEISIENKKNKEIEKLWDKHEEKRYNKKKREKEKSKKEDQKSYLYLADVPKNIENIQQFEKENILLKKQIEDKKNIKKEEIKKELLINKNQNQEAQQLLNLLTEQNAKEIIQTREIETQNDRLKRQKELKKQLLERKAIRDARKNTEQSNTLIDTSNVTSDKEVSKLVKKSQDKYKNYANYELRANAVDAQITKFSKQTDNFTNLPQKIKNIGPSFQSITTDINLAGNALNLFGQSMKAVGMSALEEAGTWEILRNKLATFTNSAEEAHERFQEIVKIGLKTPFEVKGLIQAEILLRSFGNNAKALLPKVVDLASAMGKDVDKAAYAVARAMSGASLGFLMLQKTWGVSYSKLKELGAEFKANGQIMAGSLKTQNALALSLDTLSGSAERLSRTYKGQLSNLQDSIDVLKESAGKTLLPLAKELTDKMIQLVQALNNMPGPVKQFVVSIAGVGGAAALAVGGIFNFTWQLGNFAQGLTAVKSVLPGFIKEFGKIGTIMGFASKGTKALSAEAQIMKTTIPGAFPALLGLRNVFMGAGAAGAAGAGGVAAFTAALGPILLIGAAVAGTIYLVTKALQAYEKQKQQAKDDELALREINRRTILAELDSKLHDVNNSQDAYNKLMDKGAIEVAMMADSEKIFTQALQLQNMEIQDQEKRVEVLKQKWTDAIEAQKAYKQGKLGEMELTPGARKVVDVLTVDNNEREKMWENLKNIPSSAKNLAKNVYDTGSDIIQGAIGLVAKPKQNKENIKELNQIEAKLISDNQKEIDEIRHINYWERTEKQNKRLKELTEERNKIFNDENYIHEKTLNIYKSLTKEQTSNLTTAEQILQKRKEELNLIRYQQKEVANLVSTYGSLLPAIQNIIDLQKQKQGIRPEVVNAIIENLEAEKGKLKTDTTFDEENFYRKYKAKERAFAAETGHNPGEIIFEDNKNFTDEQRKKAQEEAKKRAQEELDRFNVEAGISSVSKITPERFAQIKDQINRRDIIDKNLTTYKAFRLEDRWGSFKKLEQEAGKHYIVKDAGEREKYSKSLQESFDENFKLDWDEFNAKEEEALGKNEITQKQHLNNLEKFISSHGERLKKYNPAKYGQLWDDFNKAKEKFNKEEYKNSLNMQKDIAKAQDNKKQEIELTKRLELFALEEEYNERVKFAGKSVELDKWYYNQKREIEQKAHEDTIKELEAEYEERVALIGRAEVASEKLGTFGEKRAKENERFLNEQANADVAYMEQKRDLEKRLDGATSQEKSILYQNLNNLDKSYIAEKQKRYEEHLLDLKQLALDELKSRAELASATSEHRHKTGDISDSSYIQEQKTITQGILNELRDEAMIYEKMVIRGWELDEVEKNILVTYQQQEEKLLGLNQLAMEQLISRKGMMDSLVEHNKKMGESTDLDLLKQQKKSTEDILRANKTLADTYKKRLISGQQLTDTEFNILNTYNQQEEKLKEINTTLEYRLNKEGQIYDIAHKTFEDKLSLSISEKQITEDIANAQRVVYMEKQIEFEKEKLALLERKELTGKITDAEREILSIMRQRKVEHANLLSNISGFNDKVRNAVSQAAILSYELKHGADVTGVMSDKFKSAYEYAKSLLEQVKTIGNITASGNSYGTMGEFSSLEDMVKSQGKFGANKENAAKWKAELAMKHDMGNKDEADPVKAGRKELERQKAELQKRLESGRETEAVMKSLNEEIKYLDKQLMEGLATQNMAVTATNVSINGENVEGGNSSGDSGNNNSGQTIGNSEEQGNVNDTYSGQKTSIPVGAKNNVTSPTASTITEDTIKHSSTASIDGTSNDKNQRAFDDLQKYRSTYGSSAGKAKTDKELDEQTSFTMGQNINKHKRWDNSKGKWEYWDTIDSKPNSEVNYGKDLGSDFGYDNPSNDAKAGESGRWAVKTINRSITDYTTNFLKGMVRQNMDNLKAVNNNQYSNYNNQRSSKTENNYTINVDGRQTNISNGNNQRTVRDFVSLSLAGKTLR